MLQIRHLHKQKNRQNLITF